MDFEVENCGSVCLIKPLSQAAQEWVKENVELESYQQFGGGFVVEHRYVNQLVEAMLDAGLEME